MLTELKRRWHVSRTCGCHGLDLQNKYTWILLRNTRGCLVDPYADGGYSVEDDCD